MLKYSVIILTIFYASAKKLQVDVYYEALCPDSIRFVTEQLHPSYQNVLKYLNLTLVPFGFARADNSSGHWRFQCQHGPHECLYNKIHSCVIANNTVGTGVEFVSCAMRSPEEKSKHCANVTGVDWREVVHCLSSGEGDELLVENGEKTRSVTPPIKFIPTIVFNGIYNEKMNDEAQDHFLKIVCELLKNKPDICKKLGYIYNYIM